jgi:hypothetical protein
MNLYDFLGLELKRLVLSVFEPRSCIRCFDTVPMSLYTLQIVDNPLKNQSKSIF